MDARLWQDPFAAVADVLAKSTELKPENCYRRDSGYKDIETYCRPPWEGPSGLPDLVLVASVSGTPYAEDQEARRRRRYAVLAALDAEGFVPADAQHIGFYWPDPQPPPQEIADGPSGGDLGGSASCQCDGLAGDDRRRIAEGGPVRVVHAKARAAR